MAVKPLNEMDPGDKGRVVRVVGSRDLRRRLVEMGIVAGSDLEIKRVAPLGDPVEIKIRGSHLLLRKEEAANIKVEKV